MEEKRKLEWRPDNWENPHLSELMEQMWNMDTKSYDYIHYSNPYHVAYEDGADAMLEALKVKGYHYKPDVKYSPMTLEGIICDQDCWVVIIPEG